MNNFDILVESRKNLLAFSAGVDSTALFFLLLENNIPFDIAIVDYQQRTQSKDEIIYATQLAHKYNKKCFISNYPENKKFCEKDARDYRHNFFDAIIIENNYEALLTAHQLNDKLEWFLMQLTKGAGLSELLGMEEISYKNKYTILKPLLQFSKNDLKVYLDSNKIKYFEDASNSDQKYKRNYFRHNFSDKLINEFQSGITNSFHYLENDNNSLFKNISVQKYEELSIYAFDGDLNVGIRIIDKELKTRAIMISQATREEIIEKKELVVSHKVAVSITSGNIYIAPHIKIKMGKKFKEKCRINNIPKNIRPYLSTLNNFTF